MSSFLLLTGTLNWVKKLNWTGLSDFLKAERQPLYAPSNQASKDTGAFVQCYDNFSFFWILKAGHMVCLLPLFSKEGESPCVVMHFGSCKVHK